MTRAEVDLIVDRIEDVRKDLGERISGVEAQARITNGRVTGLEARGIADEAIRKERARILAETHEQEQEQKDSWWKRTGLAVAALAGFGTAFGAAAEFLTWLHH